jgi:hypothetical protein
MVKPTVFFEKLKFIVIIQLLFYLVSADFCMAQQSLTAINTSIFQNFSSLTTAQIANLPTGWRIGSDWPHSNYSVCR